MNDIDARSVPAYGGYYGEYRTARTSRWRRVEVNGVAQLYQTDFEAETMAWREAKRVGFGVVRSTGQKPLHVRSDAERMFGGIFHNGRQVPVERI